MKEKNKNKLQSISTKSHFEKLKLKAIKLFGCKVCKKKYKSNYELKLHLKFDHAKSTNKLSLNKCENCKQSVTIKHKCFENKFIEKKLLYDDQQNQDYKRTIIEKVGTPYNDVTEKDNLDEFQIQKHHKNDDQVLNIKKEQILCEHCPKTFDCMSRAIQHKHRIHPKYPNYYCQLCGKLFPLKIAFDDHMESAHYEKVKNEPNISIFEIFKCVVCQAKFIDQSVLDNHIKTAHVAIHDWISNAGFIPPPSTKIVKGNTSELFSLYYCHLCGSEFILKHTLKQHLLRDHSEADRIAKLPDDLIRCSVCTALFYSLKAFQTHQLNHSDKDLYAANEEERRRLINRIDQDFDITRVPGII